MDIIIEAEAPPLKQWADGSIRIGNTRVTLDTLISFYNQGESADELAAGFPTVPLADIHATIAYYLKHREHFDAYLAEREKTAADVQAEAEKPVSADGIRDRLLARLTKNSS